MGGPQAAPASNMQMPGFLARLNRAELLMAAGAALILVVDLLFSVFGPYSFSSAAWAAAAVTLLLIFLDARMMNFSAATHRALLLLLGAFALIIGIRELLSDLQFLNGFNVAATFYLGMLGYYAGTALMVLGAWTLWKTRAV
ncbi:MAG: hypothetical protein QOJ81_827 [Chloroflexota bacterium]|jgi:hypothetical protein|nr:hypothetical protein [Chloroflexota bacterium]